MDDLFGLLLSAPPPSTPAVSQPAPPSFAQVAAQPPVAPSAPIAPSPAASIAAPAQQFTSRRALREAEARGQVVVPQALVVPAAAAAIAPEPLTAPPYIASSYTPLAPSYGAASHTPTTRRAAASARPSFSTGPAPRKLKGAEKALVRASTAQQRDPHSHKNPLSVLITMGAVVGLFAVAGLPAYALSQPTSATTASGPIGSQSVVVASTASTATVTRDGYRATTEEQLAQMNADSIRAQNNADYLASGARALGDDYPWPYELAEFQGGGLSPLNYYYRECVDFVAWRLNRDAGYYSAPFKWVWSTLTPTGGDASQWRYAWEQHGWTVSTTPVKGAVAWFYGDHVAYVKSINADGTVTIEEYNYIPGKYDQRTLPISSVPDFLYPPT